jgi:hypothetical protein
MLIHSQARAPQDGLGEFTGALLLEVIGFVPSAFQDGLSGPFEKGLAKELGRVSSPNDPDLPAAALGDRSDAGVFL